MIDEPGLPDLVTEGMRTGRLDFSDDPRTVADADFVMLCVPKDTLALSAAAHDVGVPLNLVDAAVAVNRRPGSRRWRRRR